MNKDPISKQYLQLPSEPYPLMNKLMRLLSSQHGISSMQFQHSHINTLCSHYNSCMFFQTVSTSGSKSENVFFFFKLYFHFKYLNI